MGMGGMGMNMAGAAPRMPMHAGATAPRANMAMNGPAAAAMMAMSGTYIIDIFVMIFIYSVLSLTQALISGDPCLMTILTNI